MNSEIKQRVNDLLIKQRKYTFIRNFEEEVVRNNKIINLASGFIQYQFIKQAVLHFFGQSLLSVFTYIINT